MNSSVNAISRKPLLLVLLLGALLLAGCVGAGNFVWLDENGNGIQDAGEPGVEGVSVSLYKSDGAVVGSATTAADGSYQLVQQGATSGDFYLAFELPNGYEFTSQDQGGDDGLDSDVQQSNGQTPVLSLSGIVSNVDAGLVSQEALAQETTDPLAATPTLVPTSSPTPTPTPFEGASLPNVCYGPEEAKFPAGISPLSGLPVTDASLLNLRPVFLSISIFPPSVRPPTGLAVAPIIYELYIGDGDSRLMAGFYGQFPEPVFNGEQGSGSPAPEGFDVVIGDRVWFDSNGNHLQDPGEPGVAGVPVKLVDVNLKTIATTVTDAGGNYFFGLNDVAPNTEYQLRFGAPPSIADYYWVNKDAGADDVDSDVTSLGRTDLFDPTDSDFVALNLDAGLRQAYRIEGLRSGRVAYQDLQVNYCGCLVTAGADPTVAKQINTCANAFSSDPNNIGGAGLDVTRLQAIASSSTAGSCADPNLSGNEFCTQAPDGGEAGSELYVQYNKNNQNHFVFDKTMNAYTWSINEPARNSTFDLMTDRLTGETLSFENVVVMFVPHVAQNSAVTVTINLKMDHTRGKAVIFRNGKVYQAEWSTEFPAYVTDRDQPIPVHFEVNGQPFPMAPGQTWINLLNQGDSFTALDTGVWLADFDAPAYQP